MGRPPFRREPTHLSLPHKEHSVALRNALAWFQWQLNITRRFVPTPTLGPLLKRPGLGLEKRPRTWWMLHAAAGRPCSAIRTHVYMAGVGSDGTNWTCRHRPELTAPPPCMSPDRHKRDLELYTL
jgi:hypothetical protein